ncbi:MAG: Rieske 2Fe-2S domain-containing protein [Alphaproteobacteria bacterium]|nr:Rieske 2Fe-2S domain-containing protein [Alphaproteobacteria bacterium]
MLTQAENDFLTRTGPGTPMGDLLRRYWVPILGADELPHPDCPPVRVGVMSEKLLAFRDTQGRIGLIDEFCAHRGVSLWLGANAGSGIRCPYHGWKYDVTGQCTDLPSEPALCAKIKLTAYPCIEKGGVIWTYMGPPELRPPEPAFEWAEVPASRRFISRREQECNFLQAMEGGIDSVHVSFLHSGDLKSDPLHVSRGAQFTASTETRFEVVETDGGMVIGVRRPAEEGQLYWRITQWVMPFHTMIPPYGDNALNGHAWVPVDDHTVMTWCFTHHPTRDLTGAELETMRNGGGIHVKLIPGTHRPAVNRGNDYMIDRAAQSGGRSLSGVSGISMQDAAVQESQGAIQDRTREHLVSTDRAIILARRRMRRAAEAVAAGKAPDGIGPAAQRVRAASVLLPEDEPFFEAASEALVARDGVAHASV